jgi:SET domain-containing protein 6
MADDFQAKSEAFMAWLAKSSVNISSKIALRDLREYDAGRGVGKLICLQVILETILPNFFNLHSLGKRARQLIYSLVAISHIAEEELLFSIPRTSVLSVENSALSAKLRETLQGLDPWASLILVMIFEYLQGANSPWKSYFDVLPTEFNTLMFWSEDELAELQASAVRGKIGKEGADNLFKETVIPIIRENEKVFFPEEIRRNYALSDTDLLVLAHRMGSTIMAYAFDIEPVESNKEVDEEGYASEEEDEALPKGMVPLADMLNADADRNNV